MAENLEYYHVPQQNRRNKLRVTTQTFQERPSTSLQTSLPSLLQLNLPTLSSSFSSSSLQFLYPGSVQNYLRDVSYQSFNGQGLSFALPFHHFPLNLNAQQYYPVSVSRDFLKQKDDEMRSLVPLGPFTGYASILMRSKFLRPAQQILDDFCGTLYYQESDFQVDNFGESEVFRDFIAFSKRIERSWKNSKLVLMLEELYRKYKLHCQQMQSVFASFETVAGLGNAAPYILFALNAISKQFSCLKNAITDQILVSGKGIVDDGIVSKDNIPGLWTAEQSFGSQKLQNFGLLQHPVWRSQRGLPNHAVAVLKTWLFENFLNPYPTDSEKQMLAQQTGLSRSQVSNWFINARVRLWKPLVEEMQMLEERKVQRPPEVVNNHAIDMPSDHLKTLSPQMFLPPTPSQQAQHIPTKLPRNKCAHKESEEQKHVSYSDLSSNQRIGVCESSCVSLALGPHQHNRNELSRPLSMSIPCHFNLETDVGMHMKTGFEAQNHQP